MEMFGDNSSDLEDLREDYKNELIALHATLKKLDRDMDFSAILSPLLAETGPAVTHVQRQSKQIVCMKEYIKEKEEKLQADFLRQSPAQSIVGREEFVPVSLVVLQFRPDGSPLCVQP